MLVSSHEPILLVTLTAFSGGWCNSNTAKGKRRERLRNGNSSSHTPSVFSLVTRNGVEVELIEPGRGEYSDEVLTSRQPTRPPSPRPTGFNVVFFRPDTIQPYWRGRFDTAQYGTRGSEFRGWWWCLTYDFFTERNQNTAAKGGYERAGAFDPPLLPGVGKILAGSLAFSSAPTSGCDVGQVYKFGRCGEQRGTDFDTALTRWFSTDEPFGTIIVAAVADNAASDIRDSGKQCVFCFMENKRGGRYVLLSMAQHLSSRAIFLIGSRTINELIPHESYAIIGRRGGAEAGEISEDHGKAPGTHSCGGGRK